MIPFARTENTEDTHDEMREERRQSVILVFITTFATSMNEYLERRQRICKTDIGPQDVLKAVRPEHLPRRDSVGRVALFSS